MRPEIKKTPPGPNAKKIIEKDRKFSSPSYIKEYPLVVESGEGVWIYDVDGNRYLDFMAGIASASTGHAHPKVVETIKQASSKFIHVCSTDFYYESFADLCEKLTHYVPTMGPKKVFLTNSGTEAVEGAIKLVRYHTKRQNIIAFKGAFHGRTMGSISLTSSKVHQRAFFGPFLPGILHVPYANPFRCAYGIKNCEKECVCALRIESDWFKSHIDPREVAAIFIEPILGEGGYVVPPKKFLKDLRAICDKYGILLVFDEIQSGVGRTGYMYAADYFDVAPDVFLTAKGLGSGMPIGAIVAKESVMTWPRGSHGSTYAGNPVCCAAALTTLGVVEKLLPKIRSTGDFFIKRLNEMKESHPVMGDVRGLGLMIGVELIEPTTGMPDPKFMSNLEQLAFSNGLLLLGCGDSTIRFAPPLIINQEEVEIGLEIFEKCLTELEKQK